jgi:hypothetical protein
VLPSQSHRAASEKGGEGRHFLSLPACPEPSIHPSATKPHRVSQYHITTQLKVFHISYHGSPYTRCVNGSFPSATLLPRSTPAAHPTSALVQFARGFISPSQPSSAGVATTPSNPLSPRICDIHPRQHARPFAANRIVPLARSHADGRCTPPAIVNLLR